MNTCENNDYKSSQSNGVESIGNTDGFTLRLYSSSEIIMSYFIISFCRQNDSHDVEYWSLVAIPLFHWEH